MAVPMTRSVSDPIHERNLRKYMAPPLGSVVLLGEQVTARLVIASVAILGDIAFVALAGNRAAKPDSSVQARRP